MTPTGQQPATGYAQANGVDVYWESRGSGGTPLVLVHGGYGLASTFDRLAGRSRPTARSSRSNCRGTATRPTSPGRSPGTTSPMTSPR